jgi:hypothetical protein
LYQTTRRNNPEDSHLQAASAFDTACSWKPKLYIEKLRNVRIA